MAKTIRVWDLPTRLFHWGLVGCIVALVATGYIGGGAMEWHARIGYAVLTLLLFRLVWGAGGRPLVAFWHFPVFAQQRRELPPGQGAPGPSGRP
jgi:cytochrome b